MRIECAKSSKPLGVRGKNEVAFVFCSDPSKRKGTRKKYAGTKVLLSECKKCNNYRGVHKSMSVDLVYENPFGNKERIGVKNIVLSIGDADKQKEDEEKWKVEELDTMSLNQLKEMALKRGIENIEDMKLSTLKNEVLG